jgi:transcriptional regulator with XRE-family HTH domain
MGMQEKFPSRLKELREARGLSQRDVAKLVTGFGLPLTQAGVNRHENGERCPDGLTIDMYCRLYGVPAYELFLSRDAIVAYNDGLDDAPDSEEELVAATHS